jgi:UDP-N-acetyl-D-mannosaminuronic acid transferase (WecB/TagA/CpsF family)
MTVRPAGTTVLSSETGRHVTGTTGASSQANSSIRVQVLNCPVDDLSFVETLDLVERFVRSRIPHRHVAVNVDKILKARSDPKLRQIIEEADLISVDG